MKTGKKKKNLPNKAGFSWIAGNQKIGTTAPL